MLRSLETLLGILYNASNETFQCDTDDIVWNNILRMAVCRIPKIPPACHWGRSHPGVSGFFSSRYQGK